MYEYEIKYVGPKRTLYFYKDNVEFYKGETSYTAPEETLLEIAFLELEQSFPDIRSNSKRKGITETTKTQTTSSGNTSDNIIRSGVYEYKGYKNLDAIYVEIKYLGELIETREFLSSVVTTINGVTYSGIEAAMKSTQNSIQIYGTFANGKEYPKDINPLSATSSSISANPFQNQNISSYQSLATSGVSFNSIKDDMLKKAKQELDDKLEILQNLGLPPIKLIPKTLWEKTIEPKLLTERQIIKKIIMTTNQSLPIPITEEDAQLVVYGKLYYKDDMLYDNDKEDPACVASPGEPDYHKPIDENHPLWKSVVQKIEDVKKALKQLGVKLGEFAFLIPQTIATIAVSITSMVSSLVIVPFGSGIPTAMTVVQSIITAIKQLQAKAAEFLPLIAALELISLLLPKEAQDIVNKILSVFKLIIGIITGITLILGLIDTITSLLERLKAKMRSVKLNVKPKAEPNPFIIGVHESVILSVEVSGGDYDYIYEWTDSEGNIITKDPNSGEDDGTREVTPDKTFTTYTCKVTDQKGKGSSIQKNVTVSKTTK